MSEGANPGDPANFDAIRTKHAAMNDWARVRKTVTLKDGKAGVEFTAGTKDVKGWIVKAWAIAKGDVHQGAAVLP